MSEKCTTSRQTIAEEQLVKFAELADKASTLAQRTVGKLEPIMRDAEPTVDDAKDCMQAYPPLFTEYRVQFLHIQNSLATIEDCLDRTEV